MYKLNNVYKSYDKEKTFVLNNLSFEFKKGELISIIGKSGSGKTTLLKILATIDRPTEGYYIFQDINLEKMTNDQLAEFRNKHIGIVFQEYNLIENLTAEENIMLPTIFSKNKTNNEEFDVIINMLGIKSILDRKVSLLSGGEKQRVAIARSMINNPELILADEPTGNLDNDNANQLFSALKKLNGLGVTVITVTHNFDFAKKFDKTYELNDGKLNLITNY